jgi:hypothetical protein
MLGFSSANINLTPSLRRNPAAIAIISSTGPGATPSRNQLAGSSPAAPSVPEHQPCPAGTPSRRVRPRLTRTHGRKSSRGSCRTASLRADQRPPQALLGSFASWGIVRASLGPRSGRARAAFWSRSGRRRVVVMQTPPAPRNATISPCERSGCRRLMRAEPWWSGQRDFTAGMRAPSELRQVRLAQRHSLAASQPATMAPSESVQEVPLVFIRKPDL